MLVQPVPSVPIEELVDFDNLLLTFEGMLSSSAGKRLMFVRAPGGRGKTSLLRLMQSRCEQQGAPWCRVDFRGQPYDNPHFTLACEMSDQLEMSPRRMAQALLPLRPGFAGTGIRAHAETTIEGDVVDSTIITQVVTMISPTHDDLRQRYMRERLTRGFTADLGDFAEGKGVACFFDSLEDIGTEEEGWLLEALLRPVAEGKLRDVTVVTAGQRWPGTGGQAWEDHAHLFDGLPPMTPELIKIYARRVGVSLTDEVARIFWLASKKGHDPLTMGVMVKNLRAAYGGVP